MDHPPDLAPSDLATPDLATPDLATPDLAPPGLAVDDGRRWWRPAFIALAFVLLAGVAGFFPSFSWPASLTVLALGGGLFWLGLSRRTARREPPRRLDRAAAWWLVPLLLGASVELTNYLSGSDPGTHPTLSGLADPALAQYPPRAVAFLGWLAGFWALARR